ncbi:hypothetical protein GLOIN_2v1772900 [Rhizophagus irregularis DAOM 181602=DAOM 197198]|uniref:DNA-directed DNA polymerase n=1 Tax=Rhizophagus irregularis (strain DAOM 181602 / DAOM 197198 / MUCL 43194) TaxID=747089 RepID=A0A2P4Q651_RHIID|nr:hypothetical protein GLOIN_2v1772900 [Rhizophagus irregularis DAOM 181602=DAOM 197198]POG73129.1 hypothetical protein GLOIN_2v1772900 [Rhizophagus irregularis DAOM 181602=DAOM 197198]GBC52971.2 hypothetical protein GLOIN_2v1772900 [Rhizophagus irregularis DAOM 181602=DAOM 197198]|eukprot:XP_025179995.1 hypothetical protein GLOIN_2v1772900 [Rhizophagus irregularis DAOM 181602=DAOM 197198]
MSSLLGSIFGSLGNLFGYFPDSGIHLNNAPLAEQTLGYEDNNSDAFSEYDTTTSFSTRWYSASRGFLCYRESSKSNEVEFFNGITYWIGLKNEFSELSRDWFFIKVDKNETLEEAHKRYTNESIAISQKSLGLIDMRKTGTYAATSLRLFQDVTNGPIKSARLSDDEELWISNASIGSIIWAEQYEGNAAQYDINEFYPSVLLQKEAQWPIGPGEFKIITSLSNNLQYGIYRVHIEGLPKKSSLQCSQLFRFNQEEYYTHYDIEIARKNGLGVELINIMPNAYVFNPENLRSGKFLFENWAEELIPIKRQEGIAGKVAKNLLVSLWAFYVKNPRKNGKVGPHRRMKPFILALGRKTITNIIRPLKNHVKRIHTDGFILTNTIDNNLQVGPNTGELKCEKIGHVFIKNSINVSWSNTEKEIVNFVAKQGKKEKEIRIPNELVVLILEYCEKLYPLLFVNKHWNENACWMLWNKIKLNGMTGVKFFSIFGVDIKPLPYICKACPNLKDLFFIDCGHRLVNNESIEKSVIECKNLKSLGLIKQKRVSSNVILKIPILCPSLEKLVVIHCPRIRKETIEKMRILHPSLKIECVTDEGRSQEVVQLHH